MRRSAAAWLAAAVPVCVVAARTLVAVPADPPSPPAARPSAPAPAPARAESASRPAPPAEDERPLDARLFAQAQDALRAGRRDDAGRLLRRVFTEFPDSPFAPPALLKTAELIYPVTSWSQVGAAAPATLQAASELLTRLTQKYRAAREASTALVRLGYVGLEPANPRLDLDAACARFATAAQIYPDSEAADDAYFGSGMCELLRGRPARAADAFSRLLEEHPESPLFAETLYRQGLALSLLDEPAEAMLALERLRLRWPDSAFAPRVLDRLTLLHRMRLLPAQTDAGAPAAGAAAADRSASAGRGKEGAARGADWSLLYRPDPEYGAALAAGADKGGIRGISDLAVDARGLLVAASPRTPAVFRLDAKGAIQERITHPEPDYVAAAEGLAVFITGREQIAVNARNWSGPDLKGPEGRAPSDYGPIAVDAIGRVLLLDRREGALLVFDQNRRLVSAVRPSTGREARLVDLVAGDDGAVYLLDAKSRSVVLVQQGKESGRVDVGALGVEEPADLAVDGLGDLYVLDGRTGWVFVARPNGERITVVRPPKDMAARLGDVSAIAVDAGGRLYFAGRKTGVVVRLQ